MIALRKNLNGYNQRCKMSLRLIDSPKRQIFYDRQGNPITGERFSEIHDGEGHLDYVIVKQETVGTQWVSTVWTGINTAWFQETPLIFETMIFPFSQDPSDLYQDKYSTLEEAEKGHKKAIWVSAKLQAQSYLDAIEIWITNRVGFDVSLFTTQQRIILGPMFSRGGICE